MKTVVLLLVLFSSPQPVTSLGGLWSSSGPITLTWTLPADPSIAGIRVFRERLDAFNEVIFEIPGLATSYTDTTSTHSDSYRYWVQTKNGAGQLSSAVSVEFFSGDDFNAHGSVWFCWGSAGAGGAPLLPLAIGAGTLGLVFLPRRRRP